MEQVIQTNGLFISFEGPDGGGKTTQIARIAEALETAGHQVVRTREPGGSPGAEEIRRLVLEGEPDRWSPETELLLFKAARRDHVERTIKPAIEAGKIVLSDRFADSTRAYQGGVPERRTLVDQLHEMVIGIEPDLTIVIDVDPDVVLKRLSERALFDDQAALESRFEKKGTDFQHQLRASYLELATQFPQRCVVVDGHQTEDEVFAEIHQVVLARLATR